MVRRELGVEDARVTIFLPRMELNRYRVFACVECESAVGAARATVEVGLCRIPGICIGNAHPVNTPVTTDCDGHGD